MNKKILSIIGVIASMIILGAVYNVFFGTQGVEGEKEVSLQIIIDKEDINEQFNYHTEHKILEELLNEEEEALELNYAKHSGIGMMITGVLGYEANDSSEYFHILVNGEDSDTGASDIELKDGDEYVLELRNLSDYGGNGEEESEESEGKEVTFRVTIDKEDIHEEFTFQTEQEYLSELIIEEEEILEVEYENTDFGLSITEILGYTIDGSTEYFHILINGEDAETGVSGIELMDGDEYELELRSFAPMEDEEEEGAVIEGKEVTFIVTIDTEDIAEEFTFQTEQEYVSGLIEDETEVLEVEYEMTDFGMSISEILGYQMDGDGEYLHILVNGEDAETGLSGIEIKDGDVYELQRRDF